MAYVPDEAIKCGREISLAARSLYQIICAYRNRDTGECALRDQKRMAAESGINYSHLSQVKKELLEKNWITQMPSGRLKPIFGTFDKPKAVVETKEVIGNVDKPNNIVNPKIVDKPHSEISLIQNENIVNPKGTEIAIKGNISFTNGNYQQESKREPYPRNVEGFADMVDPFTAVWFEVCKRKLIQPGYEPKHKLPRGQPSLAICTMISGHVTDMESWVETVNEWDVNGYVMSNVTKIIERYREIKAGKGNGQNGSSGDGVDWAAAAAKIYGRDNQRGSTKSPETRPNGRGTD